MASDTRSDPVETAPAVPSPPRAGRVSEPSERVTVNLTARSSRALTDAVGLTGDDRTDTINRALQLYAFVEKIISEGGGVYIRASGNDEIERLFLS